MIIIAKKNYGAFKIRSIQANRLYEVQNGYQYKSNEGLKDSYLIFGEAVMNDSIFSRYMLDHGVTVNKKGYSYDFIVLKFDYFVEQYSQEQLEHPELTNEEITDWQERIKASKLRDMYYEQGVEITWNKNDKPIVYQMLMRSPGKAKEGHCIFIRENLLQTARNYLTMNLYDKMPVYEADIVGMSAYSTLITATALDFMKIPLKNILIIEDSESFITKDALSVQMDNGRCIVKEEQCEIKNELFDGEGIIDESIFPAGMNGFVYLRSHFFKSCLFRGNIQEYLKDKYGEKYETKMVRDMFGVYRRVSDIKVVVTNNSIKWLKFKELMGNTPQKAYEYYKKWMKENNDTFEIVKTAHSSKWGNLQRASYQMINSLPCVDKEQLHRIAQPSIDYYNALVTDKDAFARHLEMNKDIKYDVSRVLLALYKRNPETAHLDFFKRKRSDIATDLKNKKLKLGKLLEEGDNLTICGNPVALLMKLTGENPEEEGCFVGHEDGIECYTTRFPAGERLAAFRSPHNSMNNIVHLYNVYPELLQKYFPHLGDNVIVINGIHTDIQSRLNGQDLDTDGVYATNQADIVELALKSYKEYPTIVNDIPLSGTNKYEKNAKGYAEMDNTIAASQNYTGRSSDIAQLALSYYADFYYEKGEKNERLRDIFVICSVLAQVSIDSAKRTFDVKIDKELRKLQRKCKDFPETYRNVIVQSELTELKAIYPKFFYDNKYDKKKDKCKIRSEESAFFNCPMDMIQTIIDEEVIDTRVQKQYQLQTYYLSRVMIDKPDGICDSKQYRRVKKLVEDYTANVKKINREDEDYVDKVTEEYEKYLERFGKWRLKPITMWSLIVYALSKECKSKSRLLTLLYDYDNKMFLNCFKNSQN